MNVFNRMKIGTKILMPVILSLLILVISILIVTRYFFMLNYQRETDKLLSEKAKKINTNIADISNKALYGASICSGLDVVQRAYKEYYITNNLDSCSGLIENEFRSINELLQRNTGMEAKIHFHLPPARSFIRCWTTKRGDDLSATRNSILQISKLHQAIAGIEIDKSGVVLRGISPVMSARGIYYGSVEIIFPLEKLIEQLTIEENEEYAIFLHTDQLKIATELAEQLSNEERMTLNNFKLINKTGDGLQLSNITAGMITKGFVQLSINEVENFKYAMIPLYDYEDKAIGVGVYQLDITEYLEYLTRINYSIMIVLLILLSVFIFVIVIVIKKAVTENVNLVAKILKQLALGKLAENIEVNTFDEIGEMKIAMNSLADSLQKTASFADQIGRGNLEADFTPLSDGDVLGNSLIEMRESLKQANKIEFERRKEDELRNWARIGQAKIDAILRQHTESIEDLGHQIINNIVHYLNANIGGLFITYEENETKYLQMVSAYAYDRRKYLNKKIRFGEDLVGMCAIEKETVYKKEIPDDYIEIKSAFGETVPKYLLLVPLKFEGNVTGVIELASIKEFSKNEITFVEQISDSIASAISIALINSRTTELFAQSRKQAEELVKKETELKKNIEQLKTMQGKAARQQAEIGGFVNAVNQTVIRANLSLEGRFLYMNAKFLETLKYTPGEVTGQHLHLFLEDRDKENFDKKWKKLITIGETIEMRIRHKAKHGTIWCLSTFTPIRNEYSEIVKVLFMAIDINEDRIINLDYAGTINAIENSILKSEYRPDGTIIRDNELFLKTLGYSIEETQGNNLFDFLSDEKLRLFKGLWNQVLSGVPTINQEMMYTKSGIEKWFQGTYTAVKDYDGIIYKIIYIATEITKQKEIEKKAIEQAKELQEKETRLKRSIERLQNIKNEIETLKEREKEHHKKIIETTEKHKNTLTDLINEIPDRIALKDSFGKIVMVNNSFAASFSSKPEEIIGKSDYDFYDYETAQLLWDTEQDIIANGQKTWTESKIENNEKKVYQITKKPFVITFLNQTGVICIERDITEIVHLTEILQEKELEMEQEISQLKKQIEVLSAENPS